MDPKTIEGVGEQLVMLVKQTLGAPGGTPPSHFRLKRS